jgi:hypothetical protein
MWHAWWRGEVHTGVGRGNVKNRDHLEDAGVARRVILKWMSNKIGWDAWTGLSWLRTRTDVYVVNAVVEFWVL